MQAQSANARKKTAPKMVAREIVLVLRWKICIAQTFIAAGTQVAVPGLTQPDSSQALTDRCDLRYENV